MRYIALHDATLAHSLEMLAPESSKTTRREWLKGGRVLVDGKVISDGTIDIRKGQEVRLAAPQQRRENGILYVYEDGDLVVIDKPYGLLSVASNDPTEPSAHGFLKDHFRPLKIFVIHRLDQETSGLMIFGKSEHAYHGLKKSMQERTISRIYLGIVHGKLAEKSGTWCSYLWEDRAYHMHTSDDPARGERAVTHYELLQEGKNCSLVRFRLETGKKNQIRVQSQAAGHPIVGDTKYGSNASCRLHLHSHKLTFPHPRIDKEFSFTSRMPTIFTHTLRSRHVSD